MSVRPLLFEDLEEVVVSLEMVRLGPEEDTWVLLFAGFELDGASELVRPMKKAAPQLRAQPAAIKVVLVSIFFYFIIDLPKHSRDFFNLTVAGSESRDYGFLMKILEDDSAVMSKARELCSTIAEDADYQQLLAKVESFLNNDEARLAYQSVHESGQALNQKQQAGLELADSEIAQFESARESLMANPIASEFLGAQKDLESLQTTVGRLVGMTLELGRVPTSEDIAQTQGGGCCGGEGGEGGEGGGGGGGGGGG